MKNELGGLLEGGGSISVCALGGSARDEPKVGRKSCVSKKRRNCRCGEIMRTVLVFGRVERCRL